MRRIGTSALTTATATAAAAGVTVDAKVGCRFSLFRRYTEDKGGSQHQDQDDTKARETADTTEEEGRSEWAKMDMSTNNFTVGKFKDVERAAILQEENKRPLPEGVGEAAAAANMDCGCGDEHANRNGGASASQFGRIFSQEAAAMMTDPEIPFDASPLLAPGDEYGDAAVPWMGAGGAAPPTSPPPSSPQQQHNAAEEMQRFLAQNTLRSIQRSVEREKSRPSDTRSLHGADVRLPPGRRGVQALLDYNKQWAAEVSRFNPRYFLELAKEQKPEYLWIGCSDSRVPANEVIGLHPGDVFVHRNIGNIFSLSDLNCLSALQFAVDCLKVQHIIIAGHYKCGGVTAAMNGTSLGLTDHWIMQVTDIKNKFWDRVMLEIPEAEHLNVLCELNVLQQLSHAANCRIVQRLWKAQNEDDHFHREQNQHIYVRAQYAHEHRLTLHNLTAVHPSLRDEVECHGWVYSLDDGMLRPLLSLTRHSDLKKEMEAATEAVFVRYASQ